MRLRTAGTNLWEELTAIALLRVWIARQIESHKLSPVSIIQDGYHLNKSKYRSNVFHELKRSCSKAGGGLDFCSRLRTGNVKRKSLSWIWNFLSKCQNVDWIWIRFIYWHCTATGLGPVPGLNGKYSAIWNCSHWSETGEGTRNHCLQLCQSCSLYHPSPGPVQCE